jgi:hypothetical protein
MLHLVNLASYEKLTKVFWQIKAPTQTLFTKFNRLALIVKKRARRLTTGFFLLFSPVVYFQIIQIFFYDRFIYSLTTLESLTVKLRSQYISAVILLCFIIVFN